MSDNNKSASSLAATNPLFDAEVADEVMPSTLRKKNWAKRILMAAGVLAVAGGAFAAGYLVPEEKLPGSSIASTLVSGRDANGRVTFDRIKLKAAIVYLVQNDDVLRQSPAFTDPAIMTQAVAVYMLTGQVMPVGLTEDFLSLMSKVAPEVPDWLVQAILAGGAGRRLGAAAADDTPLFQLKAPTQDFKPYEGLMAEINTERKLAVSSLEFINQLFIYVVSDVRKMAHTVDYTHANTANDHFGIQLVGKDCYIAARETDEDADWLNNGKTGIVDILTVDGSNSLISGFAGFAETYNEMREELWNVINTECKAKGAEKYNFGGWSRGGALTSIASAALYKEGKLRANEIRLMNFGAPRSLYFWDAVRVHRRFEQWRLVYKTDFVTSLPPTWESVGHFGTLVSKDGNFPLGLDEPFFQFAQPDFADHGGYFRDWLPSATWDESRGHQAI